MSSLSAGKHFVELGFAFMAFSGVILVAYGTVAAYQGNPWPPIDRVATLMSVALTLISTAIVALSAYFPVHARPADPVSKRYLAPAAVLLVLAGVAYMFWSATVLPPVVMNGFAIMGLAGSITRLLPFSSGT